MIFADELALGTEENGFIDQVSCSFMDAQNDVQLVLAQAT
jgi:hypothetical protein